DGLEYGPDVASQKGGTARQRFVNDHGERPQVGLPTVGDTTEDQIRAAVERRSHELARATPADTEASGRGARQPRGNTATEQLDLTRRALAFPAVGEKDVLRLEIAMRVTSRVHQRERLTRLLNDRMDARRVLLGIALE